MFRRMTVFLAVSMLAAATLSSCTRPTTAPTTGAPSTGASDQEMATKLLSDIKAADYAATWAKTAKGTMYVGAEPHGALITTYLSTAAAMSMEQSSGAMPVGAIIVKEDYDKDKKLAALAVMSKQAPGYDPANADWFWARYSPAGEVQAAGKAKGCISCHAAMKSNDYVYSFVLAPVSSQGAEPTAEDQAQAREIWDKMTKEDYRKNWTLTPKGRMYQGQPPHGALLTTYLDEEASKVMTDKAGAFPRESIVAKDNFTPDGQLAGVAAMYKAKAGYDPDNGDWLYVRFGADGAVQGAGKLKGCIDCHGAAKSNDYIYTFPVAPAAP